MVIIVHCMFRYWFNLNHASQEFVRNNSVVNAIDYLYTGASHFFIGIDFSGNHLHTPNVINGADIRLLS